MNGKIVTIVLVLILALVSGRIIYNELIAGEPEETVRTSADMKG